MIPPSTAASEPAKNGAQVPSASQMCRGGKIILLVSNSLYPPPPPQDEGVVSERASEGSDHAGTIQMFLLFDHDLNLTNV